MRTGPGYSEPPRVLVWLFIALAVAGPWVYGYDRYGVAGAVGTAALVYAVYYVALKLMVVQR